MPNFLLKILHLLYVHPKIRRMHQTTHFETPKLKKNMGQITHPMGKGAGRSTPKEVLICPCKLYTTR